MKFSQNTERNLLGFLIAVGTFLAGGFAVSLLVNVYMPEHGRPAASGNAPTSRK